jgi:hypothetical protein
MTDLDCRPNPPSRIHWGRIVSLAGAAGLCASFFMPHIGFFFRTVIPAQDTVQSYGVDLVAFFLPFTTAILLLPLLAFRAVPRVDGNPGVGKFLAWALCAICLSAVTAGLGWMILVVVISTNAASSAIPGSELPPVYAVTAVTGLSLVLAIVAMVRSRLPRKAAAAQFALGASCLAYFAFFAIEWWGIYAGLWVSLAASGLLAIGAAIDWFQCRPAPKQGALANGPEVESRGVEG